MPDGRIERGFGLVACVTRLRESVFLASSLDGFPRPKITGSAHGCKYVAIIFGVRAHHFFDFLLVRASASVDNSSGWREVSIAC